MSHFIVMVAVPPEKVAEADGDLDTAIAPMLAPFHEFECTGMNNEYVVEVDQTEEARAAFEKDTERRFRAPDGELHDAYHDGFYREPTPEEEAEHGSGRDTKRFHGTGVGGGLSWHSKDWGDGKGYRAKIHECPEGWEDLQVPSSEIMGFAEWAASYYGRELLIEGQTPDLEEKHKYGWIEVRPVKAKRQIKLAADDGKVIGEHEVIRVVDRTNPNARWDWYQIGGRWSGLFSEEGTEGNPNVPASMQGLRKDGNSIRLGDWPFKQRVEAALERYGRYYDDLHAAMAGHPAPLTWEEMRAKHTTGEGDDAKTDYDAARTEFHEQPAVVAAREVVAFDASEEDIAGHWKGKLISPFDSVDDWLGEKDDVVFRKAASTVLPFAMLDKDGWHEKGKMLMFAAVADEKADWHREAMARLEAMDPDTILVGVDCHI